MNRGQGIATVGVLLLGTTLRPSLGIGSPSLDPGSDAKTASAASPAEKVKGDGPWSASCRYWEAVNDPEPLPTKEKKAASVDGKPTRGKGTTKSGATSETEGATSGTEEEPACKRDGDPWGIPKTSPQVRPQITAIIAAVPDPVHTHMSLEYDRAIDALMQAGADNGYLRSFYWMPWKSQNEAAPGSEAGTATETAAQRRREQQPGLIVLKHGAKGTEEDYPWSSYNQVIYLFIVGESPASGMNGMQLRNALLHEKSLKDLSTANKFAFQTSMQGPGDLAIIGSAASGSAVSLRVAVETARKTLDITSVHIAGATETEIAINELSRPFGDAKTEVNYLSFGEDALYEQNRTLQMAKNSGYQTERFAILAEDGTVFGNENSLPNFGNPLVIRFPRDISLLRNAQMKEKASSTDAPSPYLRLTLKDPVVNDTIPHFSPETPLSQEAELMSIQRQLLTYRAQFLAIYASNVLDEVFLANFLHRACPNMRLVFLGGGDLLLERDVENKPYVGSITITPYNLVGLMHLPAYGPARAFPDSQSEALYNAASYIFHTNDGDSSGTRNPVLAGYQATADSGGAKDAAHASLWSTVLGSDGYYPMGIVSHCASDMKNALPTFKAGAPDECVEGESGKDDELNQLKSSAAVYPSLLWTVLSLMLALYCAGHLVLLLVAWYWSPFTRDMAISEMAEPGRRSVYINIGAVMLFLMAFVLEVPAFRVGSVFHVNTASLVFASLTFAAGALAMLVTLWKTRSYAWKLPKKPWKLPDTLDTKRAGYLFFNIVALAALVSVTFAWWHICSIDMVGTAKYGFMDTKYGTFFSYRCLHPDSGVSPVVPVLLVLLGWYLWAVCQTYRLRFSEVTRPRLPATAAPMFYVSDAALNSLPNGDVNMKKSFHLYENISCLLITREVLNRFMADNPHWRKPASFLLALGYVALFFTALNVRLIESVDRMLLAPGKLPTMYESLLAGLLAPLVFICLAGALRMVLVWGALRRGVLEPLERYPLRMAFSRIKGLGWVAMMRDTGLHLRWKDMARTSEAIRQLLVNEEFATALAAARFPYRLKAHTVNASLKKHILEVRELAQGKNMQPAQIVALTGPLTTSSEKDLPSAQHLANLGGIYAIETEFAAICEAVLEGILVPYWLKKRGGFVAAESHEAKDDADKHGDDAPGGDPKYIQLAEELVALRYVSLIRAVLGNVRYLMTFVAAVFVLSLVAWNSYPFQPRQMGDWVFTLVFAVLGTVTFVVFAQMHRDSILSRITDTKPHELGMDFYWRIATFGAIPLLTWMAYQFPSIGSGLFRILQPGLDTIK